MEWVTTTQLISSLKASGESVAWQMFHAHFHPILLNFCRRMGLSESDAEDASQETMVAFLQAFRGGHYDRTKGRLSHWLFGVARNVILNARKHQPRERPVADATSGTSFWNLVPDAREALLRDSWQREWRQMVLSRCLDRVRRECDKKTFQAFELYAVGELAADEVAARLRTTRNAVYIAKNRVLGRLRELEKEFEEMDEGSSS